MDTIFESPFGMQFNNNEISTEDTSVINNNNFEEKNRIYVKDECVGGFGYGCGGVGVGDGVGLGANSSLSNAIMLFYITDANKSSSTATTSSTMAAEGDAFAERYDTLGLANATEDLFYTIDYYRHSMAMTTVYCVAYAIVFIVGLIGNSFVIAVVFRAPRMRTVTNFFIVNLAIADILVILFCLPATLMSNVFVPWVLGWLMCKTVPYIQGVSVAASVYSLIAVSIDRFFAIWWPLKQMTKRRARFMIICIWIIALTSTIPWALFFDLVPAVDVYPSSPDMWWCQEVWPPGTNGNLYFLLAHLVACYLLPMSLITLCYVLIWIKVSTRSIPGESKDAQIDRMQQKSKIKVVKMLVAVVILFVLSWLPLYAICARIKFGGELTQYEGEVLNFITPMAQWLGSSNSCINPILYAFFNKKYRRGFVAIIKSRKCCGRLRYYDNAAIISSTTSTRKSSQYHNRNGSPSIKSNIYNSYDFNSFRRNKLVMKQDSASSQNMLLKQDSQGSRQLLFKQESISSDGSRRILFKQDSENLSLSKQDSVISYIETKRGQFFKQDSDLSKKELLSVNDSGSMDSPQAGGSNKQDVSVIHFSSQDSTSSLEYNNKHPKLVKQDSVISYCDQKLENKRRQLIKQDSIISFGEPKRDTFSKQQSVAYPHRNSVGHCISILKRNTNNKENLQ